MRRLAVFAVLGCTACGGAEAVEGTFEVTSHLSSPEGDCAAGLAPVLDGETFFKLEKTSFFGQSFMGWFSCTSATDCDDSMDMQRSTVDEKDGAWSSDYELSISSWTGDPPNVSCVASGPLVTLVEQGEGVKLRAEHGRFSGTVATEEECDGDLLRANRSAIECQSIEEIVGQRVE